MLPASHVTAQEVNMWKWLGQIRVGKDFCISDSRMLTAATYLRLNHVQNVMPVVDSFTPDIMEMIRFSITFFPKLYSPGLLTCRCQLIMLMGRLMTKFMSMVPMFRARCSIRESAVSIVMTPIQ